jgi:hypothetical protein
MAQIVPERGNWGSERLCNETLEIEQIQLFMDSFLCM